MPAIQSPLRYPVLMGDIGGTNARFCVLEQPTGEPLLLGSVKTADYASIEVAISHVVAKNQSPVLRSAILAAAGPVSDHGVVLTNCPWTINPKVILAACDLEEIAIINDFEAQALAVTVLDDQHLVQIGTGKVQDKSNKVVLGPGTGLGVCGLIHAQSTWFTVAGEGGHVDMGPQSEFERNFWPFLNSAEQRVSAEMLVSGNGLVNLFQAISKARGVEPSRLSPAQITEEMVSQELPVARAAVEAFAVLLGRIAGDLALTFKASGGVYLAGGISKHIAEIFQQGEFREAFENKSPHQEFLRDVPTYVVTHEHAALEGLAVLVRNPERFGSDILEHRWGNVST